MWQFDPDPSRASEIEVTFAADGPERTVVELHHRHIDRLVEAKALHDGLAEGGGGWNGVLARFAEAVAKTA